MIDIHSHIIYGVDGGSKNIEQSIRMIKEAYTTGYTKICLTPCYNEDGFKSSRFVLEEKLLSIKKELDKEKINVDLCLGEEIRLFPSLVSSLDDLICLNDSKYVLIDFPVNQDIPYINDIINELQSAGKIPILAHPERYYRTSKDFSYILRLIDMGVLLQVNVNSIIGHYGAEAQKNAYRLLKEDLVTFLATDSHSSAGYIKARESLEIIRQLIGDEKFEKLTTINPAIVLNNDNFAEEDMVKIRRYKKIESVFLNFIKSLPVIQRMI